MHPRARAISAGILATTLTLGGLTLGSTAASADNVDITTATTFWSWIDDRSGTIDDADSYFATDEILGTTGDAFDSLGALEVTNTATAESGYFTADTVTSTVDDGVSAEFVLSGTDPSGLNEIVLTLSIEGNFARWSYAIKGPNVADLTLRFTGDLGSDDETVATVSGTTAVSNDGAYGPDPVIGYAASSDGDIGSWLIPEGDGTVELSTTGATSFTVTVFLAHYNPCGFDEALAFTTDNQSELDALFGTAYPEFGTCFTTASTSYATGVAVDVLVPLTAHHALFTGAEEDYVDELLVPLFWILSPEGGEVANTTILVVSELPPGLTGELVWDPVNGVRLHLTGTPTVAGSYSASVAINVEPGGEPQRISMPGLVPLVVTEPAVIIPTPLDPAVPVVPAAPAVPAAAEAPQLAESGADPSGLVQASLIALLFGGLLLVAARRFEAKRR